MCREDSLATPAALFFPRRRSYPIELTSWLSRGAEATWSKKRKTVRARSACALWVGCREPSRLTWRASWPCGLPSSRLRPFRPARSACGMSSLLIAHRWVHSITRHQAPDYLLREAVLGDGDFRSSSAFATRRSVTLAHFLGWLLRYSRAHHAV
jgi:hypothetical protein